MARKDRGHKETKRPKKDKAAKLAAKLAAKKASDPMPKQRPR